MAGVRDSFVDLERHRLQLEQNVANLQASLRHWQQWEIEYEGLKEEIKDLGDETSQSDLVLNCLHSQIFCHVNILDREDLEKTPTTTF